MFPRKPVLQVDPTQIVDFTTSVGSHFVNVPDQASVTKFNTGPFEAWRSGFREAAKLSSSIIRNHDPLVNKERLEIWCTKGAEAEYGQYAIDGAKAGKQFGEANISQSEVLIYLNDYNWLEEKYNEYY